MCFVFWHYLAWQLFGLLFQKLGDVFPNHLVTLAGSKLGKRSVFSAPDW
jgi:hypothetical protein